MWRTVPTPEKVGKLAVDEETASKAISRFGLNRSVPGASNMSRTSPITRESGFMAAKKAWKKASMLGNELRRFSGRLFLLPGKR